MSELSENHSSENNQTTQVKVFERIKRRFRAMKFHVWRSLGILSLGVAAFFLVAMVQPSGWEYFLRFLLRYSSITFYGYVLGLIGAAIFLSIEEEKKE